jgi:hypothetical protein
MNPKLTGYSLFLELSRAGCFGYQPDKERLRELFRLGLVENDTTRSAGYTAGTKRTVRGQALIDAIHPMIEESWKKGLRQ